MAGDVVDQMLLDQLTLPGGQHPFPVGDLVAEQVHQFPGVRSLAWYWMVTTTRSSTRLSAAWWPCRDRASASSLWRRPMSSWTRFRRLVAVLHGGQLLFHQPGQPHRRCRGLGRCCTPGSLPSRSADSRAGIPAVPGWSSSGSATASSPVAVKRQNPATAASRRPVPRPGSPAAAPRALQAWRVSPTAHAVPDPAACRPP